MKWIGALLLLSATTWVGFEFAKKLNDRPKQIRQLKNALQILEAEILYSQSPIVEACIAIGKQLPEPICWFFQSVSKDLSKGQSNLFEVWKKNIQRFWAITAMEKNEKEIMLQFGRTLGQHDFTQQQKHIQLALTHLERELQEAQDHQYRYGKMVKSLGFLTGLLIILLLI
ncbi:stage III sporulation protein SpoIIIAB [Aquibacillus sp. 3ASR75-11]|uniref:Stage III sporulation protein SpoIIIAB n=1 Tax=Terrihalobacillus insolitus TaxID=2950438 RepID=A0A9X4AP89_9BACI|nr:stage III sporulation protein SpoIIIAB [Terrihalobacillus insolitus]MDC3414423.1 stage III sporulation protein SpoIIIAB [Terrihalobacillus insolitus]MDC3425303.1 stage III sporulation protein SpoIIIAB [Terrihalobacillus insolitus]